MPRYYCDYCDTYLTHDSPSVRKQHNAGYKHKANVRTYYQQFEEQQTQSLIDQRVKEHLESKVAGFHQHVGAPTHQSYSLGYKPPISVPVLQPPSLPLPTGPPGSSQPPLLSTIRPPVLPPPTGITGYGPPPTFRPGVAPLPTPAGPPQANGAVRPPTLTPPGAPGVRSLAPPPQSVSGVMPGLPAGPPGLYQQQPPQQSQQPQQQQSGQRSTAPSGAGYSGFSYGPPASAGGYVQQRQGAPSVPSGPSGNYNPPSAVPGQSSFNYGQPPAGMTLPAQVASNSYGPSPGGPVAYRT